MTTSGLTAPANKRHTPTSTVGRGRAVKSIGSSELVKDWSDEFVNVQLGDSLDFYSRWRTPTVIVSDGGYGVLGFEGDTSDHLGLAKLVPPTHRCMVTACDASHNPVVLELRNRLGCCASCA